ncbi:MAG: tRNA (adenosine(37)-N6)-threonylcarbamoyltransferase complex dimerization subunit type 1 TsaB [Thermoanaerobaculia bacterium]|nr:tRNA (adenosine(37)-N6)-threonylcarbamoyltransferase complex dimerization subunit type 1 TsaB [Thermoanaerobaculia bacterium]
MALRLVLDTSSPMVSVATGDEDEVRAEITFPQRQSSRRLIDALDECCRAAGVSVAELDGIVALRGPGSFTGLRIGLATALGLHQATGVPATALSTLEVLAWAPEPGSRTLSVVHALREDWFVQLFTGKPPEPDAEPARMARSELASLEPERVVGYGVEDLTEALPETERIEPPPLARVACGIPGSRLTWDASRLSQPLYLARPPVSRPEKPKSVLG